MFMYNIYTYSYLYIHITCTCFVPCDDYLFVFVFLYAFFILCKSLTRAESCKLALCYMPYVYGIGCLCVKMPSVLSHLNKQINK